MVIEVEPGSFDGSKEGEHNGLGCSCEEISDISAAQGEFFFTIELSDGVLWDCLLSKLSQDSPMLTLEFLGKDYHGKYKNSSKVGQYR